MAYGMTINMSMASNEDESTSIGIKATDTNGLDIDVFNEGKDSEQTVQDAIQNFLNEYLAQLPVLQEKKEEPKEEKPKKKQIKTDSFFDVMKDDTDDFFDYIDELFYHPDKWSEEVRHILNGDEAEPTYGGFDSWQEEKECLLDELSNTTNELDDWKRDYKRLSEDYDQLADELYDMQEKVSKIEALLDSRK